MIAEHLGNAIGSKKSLGIHPANSEHPFSWSQAVAQRFDARIGREEFVVPHDLDVSGIDAEEIEGGESQKNHDDIFGERYFPVLVFPVSTPRDKVNGIIWRPKVTSDPILVGDFVVYGTRCKPHEYQEVIEGTYEAGGKVPIGVEWSW